MAVYANARIVTPDRVLSPGWLAIEGGRISALGEAGPGEQGPVRPGVVTDLAGPVSDLGGPFTDLGNQWVLPGFVDIHVHGGGGASFTEGGAEDARRAAAFHRRHGSTRIVASLVTAPVDELAERAAMLADLADEGIIDGIHLEGPFLSAARCGAQDPRYLIDPDLAAFERMRAAARGHLRMITIAPELPGAMELIRAAVAAGVVAAVGHTDATAEVTAAAVEVGASHATHLFNGMRPLDHRQPGPPGALLDAAAVGQVTCEAICDGTHLHDMTIRLIARVGGLVLVTDAMAAAGMPDGDYHLGQQAVTVAGGVARLAEGAPGAGSIAGSTATMAHVVRHTITSAGLPVTEVSAGASGSAAKVVGLAGAGALVPGADADLVVLGDDFELTGVIARGQWVEQWVEG